MNKSVDVIIPAYNAEKYLKVALDSVIQQSYPISRIIVINDGSTDSTEQIVKNYSLKDSRVEHHYQNNQGLSAARNAGIRKSTAPYLAFLDADDCWFFNKIEKQISLNSFFVYCNFQLIDSLGNYLPPTHRGPFLKGHLFEQLLYGNEILSSGSGVLIKKECFDRCGLFDESLSSSEDWDMWLRISQYFSIDFVLDSIVQIRVHTSSMQNNKSRLLESKIKVWRKCIQVYKANPETVQTAIQHHFQMTGGFGENLTLLSFEGWKNLILIWNNNPLKLFLSFLKILWRIGKQ